MTVANPLRAVTTSVRDTLKSKSAPAPALESNIIDIRRDTVEYSILEDIKRGLRPENGKEKTLPTLLLYDADGLKLFEKITYLNEYYLTNVEIEVLETYAESIAERIQPNSIVVELGSGNLRKIEILLNALDKAKKGVEYYALDLSLVELQRTLAAVPKGKFKHVQCFGLHGTYDDGLEWLKSKHISNRPKSILSMGSSVGNFKKGDAAVFLKNFADVLRPGDTILMGIDGCKDPQKVYHAYNDVAGVTHEFILNGLRHANRLLRSEGSMAAFDIQQWKVIGEYDVEHGRHVAFVMPMRDVTVDGVSIKKGERIQIEESNKYDSEEASQLFRGAGLVQGPRWTNQVGDYALHMAYRSTFEFPSKPEEYAAGPVPSLTDWDSLWTVWDTLTQQMIPKEELLSKPIKLRNACIFYLGHIPTFVDLHISRATGNFSKELESYQKIFERGIDPDVENPELVHDHSEVPDTWPPASEILTYQASVREKVKSLLTSGAAKSDPAVRKALWLGFEHEAMHLETLLYMLIQSERCLPPLGVVTPDFKAMANEAKAKSVQNEWFKIPARKISLGLDDADSDKTTLRYFGWDNEKPARTLDVASFSAQGRPITNREYAQYLEQSGIKDIPASWINTKLGAVESTNGHQNGVASNGVNGHSFIDDKSVRTVFGQIPLELALDWPVMASYNELAGYANWMGGRIPTMDEVHSLYEYVEDFKSKQLEKSISKIIPAVNSHLLNDGVEETPPSNGSTHHSSSTAAGLSPSDLFVNLQDANVGFKHWHPMPVTTSSKLAGQGEIGGVWEWTSTVLEKHEGFEPMELYPGYTADFFDGKHNIVLGGSWATHPRIAGRKTFVNWYQRNYPFVWAGARLVRDDGGEDVN